MELKKDLPDIFEDFAEARRMGFVKAKEVKDQDVPLIGVFCTYFPQEIAMAMGAATVGLCASSDETIPEAEKDLPRNLCPLIKSSYGFGKTNKCPYFYFSDLVVGETTCDGKKKMYEYLGEFKPVHVMKLPNVQNEDSLESWKKEIIRLKDVIEGQFGIPVTEENLRKAVALKNDERRAMKEFYGLSKLDPVPMLGMDMFNVLMGASFEFDRKKVPGNIRGLTEKIKAEYASGTKEMKKPRILITGCPMGAATAKVIKAIEDNGAVVVALENCSGAKAVEELVDESNPDIYDALARKYLNIGCSCMSPNPNRLKLIGEMMEDYQVDGVVDMILQACHTYNVETLSIKRFVNEKRDKPYISVETDFSTSDVGQLNTRMAAFIEML